MSKFTPGPWVVDEYERGSFDIRVHGKACIIVARNDHPCPEESLANARLITAAPDMYAALLAIMESHGPGTLGSDDIYDQACIALAKADGK